MMLLAVAVTIFQLLSVLSLHTLTVDVLILTLMMLLYTAVSIITKFASHSIDVSAFSMLL